MINDTALKPVVCVILIALCGIFVYSNSLGGKFIWDDNYLVVNNPVIRDWRRAGELFSEDVGAPSGKHYGYFRPLQILSYMLEYSLWGPNPAGYHIVNLFLHLLVSVLLFFFVLLLFGKRLWGLLAAIFYVVHPANVEVVSYISGRGDMLAVIGILIAFISYVKLSRNGAKVGLILLMIVSYACALLSKEFAVVLPFLIIIYHFSLDRKIHIKYFLILLAVLIAYLFLRARVFPVHAVTAAIVSGLGDRILGFFMAFFEYIRLLLVPTDLRMEYLRPPLYWTDPRVIVGAAAMLSLAIWAIRERKRRPCIFFSVMWFYLCLLPVSGIYPVSFFVAEHYLYFSSIGFFILLGWLIQSGLAKKRLKTAVIVSAAALFCFYAITAHLQNNFWKNELVYYKRSLKFSPDSIRVNNEMGHIYDKLGERQKAVEYYRKVISLDPDGAYAYNNIGVIMYKERNYSEALSWAKKAIALLENYPDAWVNLGNAYLNLGQTEESIGAYKKAIALWPDFAGAYGCLGNAYRQKGDLVKAFEAYQYSLKLDFSDPVTHYNLGFAYIMAGEYEKARESFEKTVNIAPNLGAAYFQLAGLARLSGDAEGAKKYAAQARAKGFQP